MSLKDVTVAILAGGKGSRLKPVVPDTPKVLAPVVGRPFLEYIFDQLMAAGLRDVVLLTGEDGDVVERCFGALFNRLGLRYSREDVPLGTAGALFNAHAAGFFNADEPVLVMNGDTLVKGLEFEALYSQREKVVVIVVDTAKAGPGGRPVTIAGDNIASIVYDPLGRYVNTGVALLPQHFFSDYSTYVGAKLEEYLFEDCRVDVASQMLDIGTPEGYAAAAGFVTEVARGRPISYLNDTAEVLAQAASVCADDIEAAATLMRKTFEAGGKVMLCGNGGSAADCQHFATDLVSQGRPAVALTTDTSFLTAYSNDHGFEDVFAAQVKALGRPGDTLIGISTSGRSRNVIRALEAADKADMQTIALTGQNDMFGHHQVCIQVPSEVTEHIQEAHAAIEHLLCKLVAE